MALGKDRKLISSEAEADCRREERK